MALSAHGISTGLCVSPEYWLELIGASEAPMLTLFCWMSVIPRPEPPAAALTVLVW